MSSNFGRRCIRKIIGLSDFEHAVSYKDEQGLVHYYCKDINLKIRIFGEGGGGGGQT